MMTAASLGAVILSKAAGRFATGALGAAGAAVAGLEAFVAVPPDVDGSAGLLSAHPETSKRVAARVLVELRTREGLMISSPDGE
jgi:hypothetical protein